MSWIHAGIDGLELEGELINEDMVYDFVPIDDPTKDEPHFISKKILGAIQHLDPGGALEIMVLPKKMKEIPDNSFVVMNGSALTGVKDNFYVKVMTIMKDKSVKGMINADGDMPRNECRGCLTLPNKAQHLRI
ncbi:MAG: hypothetical protein LBQ00_04845 [Syntrophobacterales bacterium]|nr:hypothetical protein [Syntrophobacterales bacterium]